MYKITKSWEEIKDCGIKVKNKKQLKCLMEFIIENTKVTLIDDLNGYAFPTFIHPQGCVELERLRFVKRVNNLKFKDISEKV